MSNTYTIQAPSAVVMVRPHHFTSNPETASDNSFQRPSALGQGPAVAAAAYAEVSLAAEQLQQEGVSVHLFEDRGDQATPDSVFPNNWFSTHAGGHVAIYPMFSPSRQRERRSDVIEMLKAQYRVQDVIDYSGLEHDGVFLEGTGAMVLDHVARVAYTARSNRADPLALERFCTHFNFEPVVFDTADAQCRPVYHTNVLMSVASAFAMVGFELMSDSLRAKQVHQRLTESGREVITLSAAQIGEFAGNGIELSARGERIFALSRRACDSLSRAQRATIARSARLVAMDVPTIETAGGSVRCMLAGIHLSKRTN